MLSDARFPYCQKRGVELCKRQLEGAACKAELCVDTLHEALTCGNVAVGLRKEYGTLLHTGELYGCGEQQAPDTAPAMVWQN